MTASSSRYRHASHWLESRYRWTLVPLGEGRLSVSKQMLTDSPDYQRLAACKALSADKLHTRALMALDASGLPVPGMGIEIGDGMPRAFAWRGARVATAPDLTGTEIGATRDAGWTLADHVSDDVAAQVTALTGGA